MVILLNYNSGILLEPSYFQPDIWHDQLFCLNFYFTLVEEKDKNIQFIVLLIENLVAKRLNCISTVAFNIVYEHEIFDHY